MSPNAPWAPYDGRRANLYRTVEQIPVVLVLPLAVLAGAVYSFCLWTGRHGYGFAIAAWIGFCFATLLCAAAVYRKPKTTAGALIAAYLICALALGGKWITQFEVDRRDPVELVDVREADVHIIRTDGGAIEWLQSRASVGLEMKWFPRGDRDGRGGRTEIVDQRWIYRNNSHFLQGNNMWVLWTVEAAGLIGFVWWMLRSGDPRLPSNRRDSRR